MYQPRIYRNFLEREGLYKYEVSDGESDLFVITSQSEFSAKIKELLSVYRGQLREYIKICPEFLFSLVPLNALPSAPDIVLSMISESKKAGVGPMASVAGAIAEFIGRDLMPLAKTVVIENGGDIFAIADKPIKIGIFAGNSKIVRQLAVEVAHEDTPLGICTSSGTVGHSLSFGYSDSVTIFASSASFADAVATKIGNMVKSKNDIPAALKYSETLREVKGAIIIIGNDIGIRGDIKLAE